ncbi:rNA polymerase sigma factor [Bacillus sp. CAG:988]|nr:rNA polymerase sigma factor [Bacillus sp. CAG:988]
MTPTIEELSKESGLSVERIQTLQNIPTVSTSLNALVGDEDTELGYFFSDQTSLNYIEEIENDSVIQAFSKLLDEMKLSERQKDIIMRRLGLGPNGVETLEVIGADYGLTRERIRQIQDQVIKRIQNPKYIKRMKELLKDPEKLTPKSGQELQKKEERKFLHVAWNVKSHVRPIKESQNQPKLLPPDKNALLEADVITVAEVPQSESIEKEGEKKMMSEDKTEKKPRKPWERIEGFYQTFLKDGFTREEIDNAYKSLTELQKSVACAKWGENLGEPIKATTKEQHQLQCQVSARVITPMRTRMLFYRQYGRFPHKGERTHMINEQLESLRRREEVQTRKMSPEEMEALNERLKSQKEAPKSASVSAILEQVQGNQSTPPQDAPKEEPIRSEIGKPVVILSDELPSRNELPSKDELPSDSVTNEEQPAVLPASDAKAMVPESVSAPIVATQPVPSLDRLPLDNCSLEQLTKLKNLLQSEAFTRLYQSLPLSESFVLISTFCLGKKSSEIADYMGMTKEKVDLAYDDAIELLGARLSDILETNSSFSNATTREEDLKVMRLSTNPLEPSSKN